MSLRPSHIVHDLTGIDPAKFCADNPWVRAISYDRDGTVTDYHSAEVPEEHLEVLRGFARLGIKQGFISNAGSAESAQAVDEVAEFISDAIGAEFISVTSYKVGARKPHPVPFLAFGGKTLISMANTVHVGDQWYKDVYGARMAALGGAVLVARYGKGDDWRVRLLQRPTIELAARIAMGLPKLTKKFSPTLEEI